MSPPDGVVVQKWMLLRNGVGSCALSLELRG